MHIKDSKSRFPKHNKLKFDNIVVNEDVESAQSVTIGQILENMANKHLVLAIVLKNQTTPFMFDISQLRCSYRRFDADDSDDSDSTTE